MRNFLHYLFSILLWIVFGYNWYIVFQREVSRGSLYPLGILFGITALGLSITIWWVAHNKRIASKGNRKTLMPAPLEPFEQDNLGRSVIAPDIALLQNAAQVTISIDEEGHKVYTAGSEGGS